MGDKRAVGSTVAPCCSLCYGRAEIKTLWAIAIVMGGTLTMAGAGGAGPARGIPH